MEAGYSCGGDYVVLTVACILDIAPSLASHPCHLLLEVSWEHKGELLMVSPHSGSWPTLHPPLLSPQYPLSPSLAAAPCSLHQATALLWCMGAHTGADTQGREMLWWAFLWRDKMPPIITFTRGKVYLAPSFILRLCRLVVAWRVMMGTWWVRETCFASGARMREKERSQSALQGYGPSPHFFPLGLPTEEANPQ